MSSIPSWRNDRRKTSDRGYGWQWQQARLRYLEAHPLCVMCQAEKPPRVEAATTVDHRIPHRGDQTLFWDRLNWQALCATHHNSTKQAIEKSGRAPQRIGLDGFPIETGPLEAMEPCPLGLGRRGVSRGS